MRKTKDELDTQFDRSINLPNDEVHLSSAIKAYDYEALIKDSFKHCVNTGVELLFKYYYRPLCSHAIRYVSSKEIAEDIVSDIFFKFHTEEIYLTIETSYRAYLYTMVRNKSYDYFRLSNSKNLPIDDLASYLTVTSEEQPDQITQYEDLYHDVQRAVNTLPSKRRQIYVMHRFEGKKNQQIAEELNLSVRTVESQMYIAAGQVRKMIQNKWLSQL